MCYFVVQCLESEVPTKASAGVGFVVPSTACFVTMETFTSLRLLVDTGKSPPKGQKS